MKKLAKLLFNALKLTSQESGEFEEATVLNRITDLKHGCLKSKRLNQDRSIDTLKIAISEMEDITYKASIAHKKLEFLKTFAVTKIAESQNIKVIHSSQEFGEIYSTPFLPWDHGKLVATIGTRRRDLLRKRGA